MLCRIALVFSIDDNTERKVIFEDMRPQPNESNTSFPVFLKYCAGVFCLFLTMIVVACSGESGQYVPSTLRLRSPSCSIKIRLLPRCSPTIAEAGLPTPHQVTTRKARLRSMENSHIRYRAIRSAWPTPLPLPLCSGRMARQELNRRPPQGMG